MSRTALKSYQCVQNSRQDLPYYLFIRFCLTLHNFLLQSQKETLFECERNEKTGHCCSTWSRLNALLVAFQTILRLWPRNVLDTLNEGLFLKEKPSSKMKLRIQSSKFCYLKLGHFGLRRAVKIKLRHVERYF